MFRSTSSNYQSQSDFVPDQVKARQRRQRQPEANRRMDYSVNSNPLTTSMNPHNIDDYPDMNEEDNSELGPMFLDHRYHSFSPVNIPQREQSASHIGIFICNCIFVGGLVTALVGLNNFLEPWAVAAIIVPTYLVYLCAVCSCNQMNSFLENMKTFDQYQPIYATMVNGQCFFKFWIECYHYTSSGSVGRRGSSRRKVVTHTASQIFPVASVVDRSGRIEEIVDNSKYYFVHYLKRFYFNDSASKGRLLHAYHNFVARNRRDNHQNHSNTFEIKGYQQYVGYCYKGKDSKILLYFRLFILFGLASPFTCIFERIVGRYNVKLIKEVSV